MRPHILNNFSNQLKEIFSQGAPFTSAEIVSISETPSIFNIATIVLQALPKTLDAGSALVIANHLELKLKRFSISSFCSLVNVKDSFCDAISYPPQVFLIYINILTDIRENGNGLFSENCKN